MLTPKLFLISVVGLVQIIMFYFTLRIIIAKINKKDTFYFKEKKDNIYGIFQFLMYILLIIIFNPTQKEIKLEDAEIKLFFILGTLGLINTIFN